MSRNGLSVIPPGWAWARLSEIAEIKGGLTKGQKRKPNDVLRKVPYLRVANVQRGFLDLSEVKEIEATEAEIRELKLVPGDVLFTEGGDRDKLGRGWVWRGEISDCIHQNHIFRARLRSNFLEPKLISYYGNTAGQEYFTNQGKQTTNLASINLSKLSAFTIPIPPANEQRRIVASIETHLTRLDAGVANLKLAWAKLKRYRAAVLKAACEGRLVPTEAELARAEGRDYEPADRLLARILRERRARWEADQLAAMTVQGKRPTNDKWTLKYQEPQPLGDADTAELPEGWVWASLTQLAWDAGYGTSEKCDYNGNGPPVLRIPNVSGGRIELSDMKFAVDGAKLDARESLVPGDFLVIRTNGSKDLIGRGALVRQKFDRPHHFASYLIRFRLAPARGLGEWLATVWHSPAVRQWVERVAATSAGQYNVSLSTLNNLAVPLPPASEQSRIVAEVERRLSLIDELETAIAANLKRADRLRQSILKRAFEGKLVPQDPADEPSDVLLERIGVSRAAKPNTSKGLDFCHTPEHHRTGGANASQATLFPDIDPPPRNRKSRRS